MSAEDLYYTNCDRDLTVYAGRECTTPRDTDDSHLGLRGGYAGPVCQTPCAGRPEHPRLAPPRKKMNRAAMANIAADIMVMWASAERRVMIKDLIAEQPNHPEKLDEGLFVYHTDADQVAMRKWFDASYANGLEEGRQMALQRSSNLYSWGKFIRQASNLES